MKPPDEGKSEWERIEREFIQKKLALHAGNLTRTARNIGIARNTLVARMKWLGVPKPGRPMK